MKKRRINVKLNLYAFILLVVLVSTFTQTGKSDTTPTVYVSPPSRTVSLGSHFSVDVDLDNVSNLYGYEIWLSFDSSKLNAVALKYGGFLNEPTHMWAQTINNTGGYIDYACSSLHPAPAKSGGSPPPLLTINFTAKAPGASPLHLVENKTILVSSLNGGTSIVHQTTDGSVTVGSGTHDVALTNVEPSKTVVGQGSSVGINVTVANFGVYPEVFNVTTCANSTIIGVMQVSLASGNSTIIPFTWNTTSFAYSHYNLTAYATPVTGDMNTANDRFAFGIVTVTVPGDINGDGKVNVLDLISVAIHLGHSYPWPHLPVYSSDWYKCANSDTNNDGKHNVLDLIVCATHLGQHW